MAEESLLRGARVLVVSQITGTAEYQPTSGAVAGPPGPLAALGEWVLRTLVRPAVYLQLSSGGPTMALEPYGRPERDLRGVAAVTVAAAVVGTVWGLVQVGQWLERRAKRRR